MAYHRVHGLDSRIVRIFNTYGSRMRPHDGRAIPTFLRQALQDRPLTVFGDGSQTRSFCYVSDLIDGLVRAAAVDEFDSPINLGNPNECTMLELAETVMDVAGTRVELDRRPLPADDPRRRCPDIGKARRYLEFEPSVPLKVGIQKTFENFRERRSVMMRAAISPAQRPASS